MENPRIGTADWFTQSADKLLGLGMDVLRYETMKGSTSGGETSQAQSTATSMIESKLPYILGGVALIGIGVILWKR